MGVTIAVSMRPKGAEAGSPAGFTVSLIYERYRARTRRRIAGTVAAGTTLCRHDTRAPPSHTWRGLPLLSGDARGKLGSDTPAPHCRGDVGSDGSARRLCCFTICNQRVTHSALGADNEGDADGVGPPELTSRRLFFAQPESCHSERVALNPIRPG